MVDQELKNLYDAVVIGGGPAGLTAALYLARAKYRVVVVEKEKFGGQITITEEIVNYPGVGKTSGTKLTETIRKQAEDFGAEFIMANALEVDIDGEIKTIKTDRGELKAYGLLIATGAHPRMIGFDGEANFKGRGVAYCATCDGEFFTGKPVFVVGGGFAAVEEGVFLTKYASHVTILVRKDDFSCAKSVADKAKNNENITVLYNTEVVNVTGDDKIRQIRYKNNKSGEEQVYNAEDGSNIGVFVFAGYEPATELIKDKLDLTEDGYIVTDRQQKTSADGVYAAGDICVKNLRQVVTAVGDGALAATELEKHASLMHDKVGIIPEFNEPEVKSKSSDASATSSSGLFSEDMLAQLNTIFDRMENPLVLKLSLDDREVSRELEAYINELVSLTDKLTVVRDDSIDEAKPCVHIYKADDTDTGLAFHGVPGGHEFTSFVLGLYNAAGPGQAVDDVLMQKINAIDSPVDIKIMVSLTCTMCPDLVTSAQKIAAENPNVRAEVYDLNHFADMRDEYNVMSVPCFVINGGEPNFGKKNIQELLDLI